MRSLYRILALPLALATACEAGVEATPDAAFGDASPGPGPAPTPDYVRYRGTLATSPTVPFGGGGYCDYSVTLRTIVFDVVLRSTRELASMSVEDTMVEAVVGTCPYAPAPMNRQHFAHASGRPVPAADGVFDPILLGVTANRPMTAVTAPVTVLPDGRVQATARWERTDQTPPLKWIVSTSAPVTLQPMTCERGATLCLGGSGGMLYTCEDGTRMTPARLCAAGCDAAQLACN